MHLVRIGDQDGQSQHEKQNMPNQEIRAPLRELENLDEEFPSCLEDGPCAKAPSVPPPGPPSPVDFVVPEFTG